jgi:hypothetical protein
MLRPTRSIVVTGMLILAGGPELQSAETTVSRSLFFEQKRFCFLQGNGWRSNAWAIAKVARGGRQLCENCGPMMRV